MQGNSRGCALNNYCMPISYWFAQLKIHGVPAMCQTLSQTLETEQQPDRAGLDCYGAYTPGWRVGKNTGRRGKEKETGEWSSPVTQELRVYALTKCQTVFQRGCITLHPFHKVCGFQFLYILASICYYLTSKK